MNDPQIFESMEKLQEFIDLQVQTHFWRKAEALKMTAEQYELRTLQMPDVVEKAWLEGVSEGLRTAAAELEPTVKV